MWQLLRPTSTNRPIRIRHKLTHNTVAGEIFCKHPLWIKFRGKKNIRDKNAEDETEAKRKTLERCGSLFTVLLHFRNTRVAQMDDASRWRASALTYFFSIYIAPLRFTTHSSHDVTRCKLISYSLTQIAAGILLDPSRTLWHAINLHDRCVVCCCRTV